MQPTEPAAPAPSFLEKVGAQALDLIIPQAQAEESYVLAFVDGEIAAGTTDVGGAIVKALSAKVPLLGGTLGADVTAELGPIDTSIDGYVKAGYDKLIALLQAKAKSWGG